MRFCLIHGYRLHLIPKSLAKYRIHETQLSQLKIGKTLKKSKEIRERILEKLEKNEQEKYKNALKKIKKKKALTIQIRHILRDIMFKVFPESLTEYILKLYFHKIKDITK